MKTYAILSSGILAALTACGSPEVVGTTTLTSAAAVDQGSLATGAACANDLACKTGFCDHPMGFCEVPGVCRERPRCSATEVAGLSRLGTSDAVCAVPAPERAPRALCVQGLAHARTNARFARAPGEAEDVVVEPR